MPKAKDRLIFAFDFQNIVTIKPDPAFPKYKKILLDYMYGRISETTLLIRLNDIYMPIASDTLKESTTEKGWALILNAAGNLEFVLKFQKMIRDLRSAYPDSLIGIATNDVPQLNDMLIKTNIKSKLDFVIISSLINCEKPSSDFFNHLTEIVGDGRIILIETFDSQLYPSNDSFEKIYYDNRICTDSLYKTIEEYLSH